MKTINYKGKTVYMGIDVHKKSYSICAWCDGVEVRKWTMPAIIKGLIGHIQKNYVGARVKSAYEAGFSGLVLHRELVTAGIENIVINPASIEVASCDKKKTDLRDARKIAEQLSVGRLKGIRIPTEKEELARQITRTREQIVVSRNRVSNQIKKRLQYFGLMDMNDDRVACKSYMEELLELELPEELKFSLKLLIEEWLFFSGQLDELKIKMKEQSFEDAYNEEVYRSVPGIGEVSARILSNELGDLSKNFPSQKALYQFTGLTPSEHSSGEKIHRGHIDRQGSPRVRHLLVEAAWVAIKKDGALEEAFKRVAHRRGAKRAIVAIARKLIGRIRACFQQQNLYVLGLAQ
jgi:transposase